MFDATRSKTKIALISGENKGIDIISFKFRNQKKKVIKTMKVKSSFSGLTLNLGNDKLLV